MLQKPGHSSAIGNQANAIITELLGTESRANKAWKDKYYEEYKKERKEKKKFLLEHGALPKKDIGITSDPEYRAIGYGICKFDDRNLYLEKVRGGVSENEEVQKTKTSNPISKFGRTKKLEHSFYDLSGISCFGEKKDPDVDSSEEDEDDHASVHSAHSNASRVSGLGNQSTFSFYSNDLPVPKSTLQSTYSSCYKGARK